MGAGAAPAIGAVINTRRRPYASEPFHKELDAMLAETEFVTSGGRPNLAAFVEHLDGVSYEVLRRAARGTTVPSLRLLEEVARVLGLRPEYFLEYRIARAAARLDLRRGDLSDVLRAVSRLESLDRRCESESSRHLEDDLIDAQAPPFPPEIHAQLAVLMTEALAQVKEVNAE